MRALESGRKASLRQCVLIVIILQSQKVSRKLPNCLKRAETSVVLILFDCVLGEVLAYTVTVSYHRST
jgi:hypothetical protein